MNARDTNDTTGSKRTDSEPTVRAKQIDDRFALLGTESLDEWLVGDAVEVEQ